MRRAFSAFLGAVSLMFVLVGGARTARALAEGQSQAEAPTEVASLYTIHPGTTIFEKFGHSLLCIEPAIQPSRAYEEGATAPPELLDARCYDFGVFSEADARKVVEGSLKGRAMFVPRELSYSQAVQQYRLLDRTIERQKLPLSNQKVAELQRELDELLLAEQPYAYHPFFNNCSTQIRDLLDRVTGQEPPPGSRASSKKTWREHVMEGFSGQVLYLIGVEFLVGSSADVRPTAWQSSAFPLGLRTLVEQGWGARSETVYQQTWKALPTSAQAGRMALLLIGATLGWAVWWSRRNADPNIWVERGVPLLVFYLIAGLGLVALGLRLFSGYPEFSSNFAPLILFPGDLALPWLPARLQKKYVVARLFFVVIMVLLSFTTVISQPLWALGCLSALPLAAMLAERPSR